MISRSTTRARHRMRCGSGKCRYRFTLKKRPFGHVECPSCGKAAHSVEAQRRRELARQTTCRCTGYPFPHRRGTLTMCGFNPERLAGIEPTPERIEEYEGALARPRTAWSWGPETPSETDMLPEAPF